MSNRSVTTNAVIGAVLIGSLLVGVQQLHADDIEVIEIPTLGGDVSNAWSVNNHGQVTGTAFDEFGDFQPFLWENGIITSLNDGSFARGSAAHINNNGEIVGSIPSEGSVAQRGFHWSSGVLTILEPPSGSSDHFTEAQGINDSGQIIGSAAVNGPNGFEAFIWQAGSASPVVNLPQITGTGNGFYAGHKINNNGQITGFYDSNLDPWFPWRGYTFVDGESVDVGTLGDDASFVEAWGINDAGNIVGYSDTNFFLDTRAFLLNESGMINLGTLEGGDFSSAFEVNNHDWVVGDARNAEGQLRAFLWRNGEMIDLNHLIAPDSGWVLERGRSISDTGFIVGLGRKDGEQRGFLMYVPTGDLNGDGTVDGLDLFALLAAWGPSPKDDVCLADFNGDGVVDGNDLLFLLANWG